MRYSAIKFGKNTVICICRGYWSENFILRFHEQHFVLISDFPIVTACSYPGHVEQKVEACSIKTEIHYYRPRSESSEGYIFTGICLSNSGGGDGGRWVTMDQVTTPPPETGTWSQHLPPGTGTWSQHLPPWDWDLVTTHPLGLGPGYNTPLPPGLCAGGQYASYWNAFLFSVKFWQTPLQLDSIMYFHHKT